MIQHYPHPVFRKYLHTFQPTVLLFSIDVDVFDLGFFIYMRNISFKISAILGTPMPKLYLTTAPHADFDTKQTTTINNFVKVDHRESRAIAFHKVGTGKTRLAYGWFLLLRQARRSNRTLIIIKPKGLYDWREEAKRIGFDRSGITFVSYANLKTVNLKIDYDTIIVDELYLFGNPKSYRSRRLAYLAGRATNTLGLTGTILPKDDNTSIWGYCVALGMSDLIARGITDFRSRYQTSFVPKFNGEIHLFRPKHGWEKDLFSRLGKRVSFYYPRNYVRSINREIRCDQTREQTKLINKLVNLYVLDTPAGEVFYKSATDVYHAARKIANGWTPNADGTFHMVACEKRDTILEKVCELHDANEPHIIWCAYRNDVAMLRDLLPFKTLLMVGGKPFDVATWSRGKINTVIATISSGSSVDYFSHVKWGLFYSLSPKRLDWQQAKGRHGRRGADSSSPNQFLRYTTSGSVDERIYSAISETEISEKNLIRQFQIDYNIKLPLE